MNIFLLIAVSCTLALGYRWQGVAAFNQHPCQPNNYNNAYNQFVHKHIVSTSFNRNSRTAWQKYLRAKNLCDTRRPVQTFIEKWNQVAVNNICNGQGVRQGGNLCTSINKIEEYTLNIDNNCKVFQLYIRKKYLVVACDKVTSENRCLPVHFETTKYRRPSSSAPCSPSKRILKSFSSYA